MRYHCKVHFLSCPDINLNTTYGLVEQVQSYEVGAIKTYYYRQYSACDSFISLCFKFAFFQGLHDVLLVQRSNSPHLEEGFECKRGVAVSSGHLVKVSTKHQLTPGNVRECVWAL